MLNRRALFGGLLATLAAPAIIRTPGLLMQVKAVKPTDYMWSVVMPDGGVIIKFSNMYPSETCDEWAYRHISAYKVGGYGEAMSIYDV